MWSNGDVRVYFPEVDQVEQGKEFFWVEGNGTREKVCFHDYDRIYEIPGLYEYLFYERYRCNSPEVVCSLLKEHLDETTNGDQAGLCVLDIGAGNGMVGEQLVEIGAESVVGIDIIEEAAQALERDRPELYEDYHIADLTRLPEKVESSLKEKNFNCMTVVAALGFDDIPPLAFANGYNLVSQSGWVAFNIKEDFVCEADSTGFCQLIERMVADEMLDVQKRRRYRHRFCQDGTPLYYHAVVGKKQQHIPEQMIEEFK